MRNSMKTALYLSMAVFLSAGLFCGCSTDTGVPVRTVKKTSEVKINRSTIDRAMLEMSADNWKPVDAESQDMQARNPFRGFSDTIAAENLLRRKMKEENGSSNELQLPEQLYSTREYRVIGVITGTAEPKVYVVDPAGNRFVLRRGSLLGNNNGSISSIRRDGIEVYERVADSGQYIELPLYEGGQTDSKHNNIQLSLH